MRRALRRSLLLRCDILSFLQLAERRLVSWVWLLGCRPSGLAGGLRDNRTGTATAGGVLVQR